MSQAADSNVPRGTSCPICGAGPNAWCLERHVAEARDRIEALEQEAAVIRTETDAYEKAGLERTGQAGFVATFGRA